MQEDKLGQLWDSFFPYCAWVGRGEFYHPLLCTPSCLQIVLVHNAAPVEKLVIKSREQKLLEEMPLYIIPMNSLNQDLKILISSPKSKWMSTLMIFGFEAPTHLSNMHDVNLLTILKFIFGCLFIWNNSEFVRSNFEVNCQWRINVVFVFGILKNPYVNQFYSKWWGMMLLEG